MQEVEFELSLSDQPSGIVLAGEFSFEVDVRVLLFAWNGQDMAWAKESGHLRSAKLDICYHPCRGDDIQLLARIGGSVSTDLMLKSTQCPTVGMTCRAELSVPSVLYRTINHGLGLLVIPTELTKSRRKCLWHIRSGELPEKFAMFEQAQGRRGIFDNHPFA